MFYWNERDRYDNIMTESPPSSYYLSGICVAIITFFFAFITTIIFSYLSFLTHSNYQMNFFVARLLASWLECAVTKMRQRPQRASWNEVRKSSESEVIASFISWLLKWRCRSFVWKAKIANILIFSLHTTRILRITRRENSSKFWKCLLKGNRSIFIREKTNTNNS